MLLPWLYEAVFQRRKTFDYYREYLANEKLSAEQITALRWHKIQALLKHCYDNVPYYQKQWQALGIKPENIHSADDLAQLPILTKDLIRENYSDLVARNYKNNIVKTTGGSSGVPLRFQLDLESDERRRSIMWRGYRWAGYEMGQRTLYLWGADAGPKSWRSRWKDKLYHRVYNRHILNSFAMTTANMGNYVADFNTYKPEVVVSYVTPLLLLADWISANQQTIFSPKVILTGAEALRDYQRERLEHVFGCKVVNTYGCREFMLIGAECAQCGQMHSNDDHLLLETVDAQNQKIYGEAGDLLITDLHNYGFPLIRYRNGDRVTLNGKANEKTNEKTQACHLPFSVIAEIHGRQLEHIVTLAGNILPGEFFPHLLKDVVGLIKFQVLQKTADCVELHFVRGNNFDQARWDWSLVQIRQQLGDNMQLQCFLQQDIPLTVSGKHLVCVNEWLKNQGGV
jgi:phenylacetate-CoA ligase